MNCAPFYERRGRTALLLADILTRWAAWLRRLATRDITRATMPDDLFSRKERRQ